MFTKSSILFSGILNKHHRLFSDFKSISERYGHEVLQANTTDQVLRYIKEKDAGAIFCDSGLYRKELKEGLENAGIYGKLPVVLLIEEISSSSSYDKRVDGVVIMDVPENIFEVSTSGVYKFIQTRQKLRNVEGVIDPDFIKKLLSSTAHAINNILTGMQGYAELVQLNPDDKKLIQDSINVVIDSSSRVRNEIKNLRAFARAENPQFDRVNITDIISESFALAKNRIKSKNVDLHTDFPKNIFINGDYDQLIQVFFNLINDILNYISDNGAISCSNSDSDNVVKIIITGNNCQLNGEEFGSLENIFAFNEPVLKMDSREGKIENRNVLSICNHIVHNHGGSVNVIKAGKKLSYTVFLPMLEVSEKPEVPALPYEEAMKNLDMDILVVDDEEYVRNTIYYFFSKKGCRVTLAEDGEFGLNVARARPLDLIFMDYLMPKMGGIESARKILENNRDVKIVFITGRDTLEQEQQLYNSGIYACIKKPFEMKDLYRVAKKVAMEKGLVG